MKVALLSDLHANIHALNVVMDDLDKEGVEKIIVAGDVVGYYYWPRHVVELIMADKRFSCVRGNHENILQQVLVDDEAAQRYRCKYGAGYDFCRRELSKTQMDWLLSLPDEVRLEINGIGFHVGHGALGNTDKYLYPDTPAKTLAENCSDLEYTVYGHTHYPFLYEKEGKYLLNPGSVGQPRDMGGMASYVIINTGNRTIRFKKKVFDKALVISAAYENDPELEYLATIMNR